MLSAKKQSPGMTNTAKLLKSDVIILNFEQGEILNQCLENASKSAGQYGHITNELISHHHEKSFINLGPGQATLQELSDVVRTL